MGLPLFYMRPDLFPEGRMTQTELSLWSLHFTERQEAMDERKEELEAAQRANVRRRS